VHHRRVKKKWYSRPTEIDERGRRKFTVKRIERGILGKRCPYNTGEETQGDSQPLTDKKKEVILIRRFKKGVGDRRGCTAKSQAEGGTQPLKERKGQRKARGNAHG